MSADILYFGRNAAMMALVGNELKAAGIAAEGFLDDAALMAAMQDRPVRLLVIGAGVEDGPRARLKEHCTARGVKVLEHFEGPGLLPAAIRRVL